MKDTISMPPVDTGMQATVSPLSGALNSDTETGIPSEFTALFSAYIDDTGEIIDGNVTELFMAMPMTDADSGNILPFDGSSQPLPQGWGVYSQMPLSDYLAKSNNLNVELTDGGDFLLGQQKSRAEILEQPILLTTTIQKPVVQEQMVEMTTDEIMQQHLNNFKAQQQLNLSAANIPAADPAIVDAEIDGLPLPANMQTNTLLAAGTGLGSAGTQQTQNQVLSLTPVNITQPNWEPNLASRMQWMIGKNIQHAEIRLDPPELGSLEVSVQVNRDQATVNFVSPHAHVRDAIEAAVPRLREMMEQNGLSLADVNVQQESFAQQQNSSEESSHGEQNVVTNDIVIESEIKSDTPSIHNGLVDAYA